MPAKTLCPVCGPGVPIDEDGCCAQCGATATGKVADEVLARLGAAEARLAEVREVVDKAVAWGRFLEPETSFEEACARADEAAAAENEMCEAIKRYRARLSASPPAAPPEASPNTEALKAEVRRVLGAALGGRDERYLLDGQFTRWGLVEKDIVAAIDALAPPHPTAPLVQAVLDAAIARDAYTHDPTEAVWNDETWNALEAELDRAVAALRASRTDKGEPGDG